jgi:thymidine kinase
LLSWRCRRHVTYRSFIDDVFFIVLVVIVGPMFASKTTELIRRVERQVIAGWQAAVFKPSLDAKHDVSKVAAHNGLKFDAYVVPPEEAGVSTTWSPWTRSSSSPEPRGGS